MVALREPDLAHGRVSGARAPRLLTEADIPWIADLMRRRYTKRADPMALEAWFRGVVLKQPAIWLHVRTDNAFVMAVINVMPWIPSEMELATVLVCAEEGRMWELIDLLRFSMEWGKVRRCTHWQISSVTHFDLGPIAKRLGPVEIEPHYKLRLV